MNRRSTTECRVPAGRGYVREMRGELDRLATEIAEADEAAVAARDPGAAIRHNRRALDARRRRVRWLAVAHLPRSAQGLGLVHRIDRFLAEFGAELGPGLVDALAERLNPDTRR